jgi:hypothetical protein
MKATDACVYRGPSAIDGSPIRVIVTGVARPSQNRKTGAMAQVWILADGTGAGTAMDAMRSGRDAAVCGACPLAGTRGDDGARTGRACYVNVGQAPNSVTRGDARGTYVDMTPEDAGIMLAGRSVRLGAYGDPAAAPYAVMAALVAHADNWTGYTHQWRTAARDWSGLLMASVETLQDRDEAHALGYRTFRVTAPDAPMAAREVECAATRDRNPLQCIACGMCAGTKLGSRPGRVDVVIAAHGSGAKYVSA